MLNAVPGKSSNPIVLPDPNDQQPSQDAIAKAQAILRRYIPEGYLLSEELIRDRRAECE